VRILITGGTGYIGSHTCVELLTAGFNLVVVDNLSNSSLESLKRVAGIVQVDLDCHGLQSRIDSGLSRFTHDDSKLIYVEGDIRSPWFLRSVFARFEIEAVIHFAALKAVGESMALPLRYYDNNVSGSLVLFDVMAEFGCKRLVFSSSATVYGNSAAVPIAEDAPLSPNNPYGQSKLMVENVLRDLAASDPSWGIAILRYFNPVGAHSSGLIGEDPNCVPNNLLPYIAQVSVGKLPHLKDDCRLRRNRLKGALGDALHVLGCAAGYNLRWLLRWIALFWASILRLFTGIFGLPNREIGMQAA